MPRTLLTPECWKRGKPDPEPYLLGATALAADPTACVVLEDAPSGVESGVAAGMYVVAVLTSHARLELIGAASYIESLHELPQALARTRWSE